MLNCPFQAPGYYLNLYRDGGDYFLPAWARDIAWHADTSLDIIIKAKI